MTDLFPFDFRVYRVFHAGYVFETHKTRILFDPIFENPLSQNCFAYPDVQFNHSQISQATFDAVFISHYHDDHFSLKSLQHLDRNIPVYMFCIHPEPLIQMKNLGFKKVYSLNLEETLQMGDFQIKPHRALDEEVDCIFQIRILDYQILNVVDSWIDLEKFEELSSIKVWDLVLWPFQSMREIEVLAPTRFPPSDQKVPIEHLEQIQQLSPKFLVPSSCQFIHENWSWYRQAYFPISYQSFTNQIEDICPSTKVIRMNPSTCLQFYQHQISRGPNLNWVPPVGPQDVDYEYDPDIVPTPTSEIAKLLSATNSEQKQRVHSFCESEILMRYEDLELSIEEYFANSVLWNLKIYDSSGEGTNYFYELFENKMKHVTSCDPNEIGWQTEIPLIKLFNALESSETLSSLYIRINDCQFNSKTEKNLKDVDILEDPLIRTLYTGRFQVLFPERYGVL